MTGTSPQRIRLRRTKGWRLPEGAVVAARPSKWGNPISVAQVKDQYPSLSKRQIATLTVRHFERIARRGSFSSPNWRFRGGRRGPITWTYPSIDDIRAELGGRDLACWCPLEDGEGNRVPCHADVLLAISNRQGS